MQVLLKVLAPNKPAKNVKVSRDVLIGREKGRCDLRIASGEVSRKHCRILVHESAVAVRDLGSSNGTRVNGELIPPKTNFPIDPGDTIKVGPIEIFVRFKALAQKSGTEDEFLSQDNALAALDMPGGDMDQSAAEVLIESRLPGDQREPGSGSETIDTVPGNAENALAFDDSSVDQHPEQFAPVESQPELPASGEIIGPELNLDDDPEEPADRAAEETPELAEVELLDDEPHVLEEDVSERPAESPSQSISGDLDAPPGGEMWSPPDEGWEDPEEELVSVDDIGSLDQPSDGSIEEVEELDSLDDEEEYEESTEPVDPGFANFLDNLDEPS